MERSTKKEYGYNIEFEQYVMETISDFMKTYDPSKDRVWLASCFGEMVADDRHYPPA